MGKVNLLSYLNKKDNFFVPHWIILIIIICLGFHVRFIDLATHFSHCDDNGVAVSILKAKKQLDINYIKIQLRENKNDGKRIFLRKVEEYGLLEPLISIINRLKLERFLIIPSTWTYAPLQYLFTPFLISDKMSYQEILFWGRLPSFIFSIITLLLIIPIYKKFKEGEYLPYLIFCFVLVTFSWENIIYAKQMSSYSLGVLAAILIFLLLLNNLNSNNFSQKKLLINSIILAILSHAQYQIFLFIPGFYLTLFIYFFAKTNKQFTLIKNFFLSIVCYLILVFPLYYLFLRTNVSRGVSWLSNTPFILTLNSDSSIFENFSKVITFFIKNSLIIIQANFAFVPESHPLYIFFSWVLTILILLGVLNFFTTKNIKERYVGLFFLTLIAIWVFLVYEKKLALSPTRHSLILLPYMAIIASEGLGLITNKIGLLSNKNTFHNILSLTISILIIIFFFTCFQKVVKERQDPFNETEIYNLLKGYKVDMVISYGATTNLSIMFQQKIIPWNYIQSDDREEGIKIYHNKPKYNRIAFISHRIKFNELVFNEIKQSINIFPQINNTFNYNYKDFKLIFTKEINSNIEVDFSSKTKNGTNEFYFYILEKIAKG